MHRRDVEEGIRDRAAALDPAAWRELERLCRPALFAVLGRRGLSRADLEDAWGDVVLDLLRRDCRKLRIWDPAKGSLVSWVTMLGLHCADDDRKRRHRGEGKHRVEEPRLVDFGMIPSTTLSAVVAVEGARALVRASEALPPVQRRFFRLLFVEGRRITSQQAHHAKHRMLRRLAPLVAEVLA